jgi:hypothetical protein
LRKKLFQQIIGLAEDLGDPTDPVKGWNVVVNKTKTGPSAINVDYTVKALKCKVAPLTEEQLKNLAEADPLDVLFPRQTADEQLVMLKNLQTNGANEAGSEEDSSDGAKEAAKEFDDIPF